MVWMFYIAMIVFSSSIFAASEEKLDFSTEKEGYSPSRELGTPVWDELSEICADTINPWQWKLRQLVIMTSFEIMEEKRRKTVNAFLHLIKQVKIEQTPDVSSEIDLVFQSLERAIEILINAENIQFDQIPKVGDLVSQGEVVMSSFLPFFTTAQQRGFNQRLQKMHENLARSGHEMNGLSCRKMSYQEIIDDEFKQAMRSENPLGYVYEMLQNGKIPNIELMTEYISVSLCQQDFLVMIEQVNPELYVQLISLLFS